MSSPRWRFSTHWRRRGQGATAAGERAGARPVRRRGLPQRRRHQHPRRCGCWRDRGGGADGLALATAVATQRRTPAPARDAYAFDVAESGAALAGTLVRGSLRRRRAPACGATRRRRTPANAACGRARDAHAHLRPRRAVGPEDSCGHRGLVGYEMPRRGSRCPDRLDRPRLPGARSTGARGHSRTRAPWRAYNPLAVSAAISLDGSRRARDPVLRGGDAQVRANASLVDLLLAPAQGGRASLRPELQRSLKICSDRSPATMSSPFIVLVGSTDCDCCGGGGWRWPRPRSVRVGHGRTAPPGSAAKDHDAIPTPDDKSREDIGRAAEDVSADALISFDGVW